MRRGGHKLPLPVIHSITGALKSPSENKVVCAVSHPKRVSHVTVPDGTGHESELWLQHLYWFVSSLG